MNYGIVRVSKSHVESKREERQTTNKQTRYLYSLWPVLSLTMAILKLHK